MAIKAELISKPPHKTCWLTLYVRDDSRIDEIKEALAAEGWEHTVTSGNDETSMEFFKKGSGPFGCWSDEDAIKFDQEVRLLITSAYGIKIKRVKLESAD